MANSDKNIRITTSKNKTTYPNIVFTGSAAGSSVITLEVLDDNTLSFTSNEGQVFSIDSNLSTGTIWAVSDISGVPLLSASAGGTIGLGVYGGTIAIGQTNPAYKLDLKGSFGLASANDGLYNFIFSNNAASGSNNLQIRSANSLLLYNSGNTFYTGLKSNASANVTYTLPANDGSADQFLKTNGSGILSWGTPAGGSGGGSTGVGQGGQYELAYYPGTGASVIGNPNVKSNTVTSVVSVTYTTASTDYNTGALTVSGGVGIGGSLFVGGIGASISGVSFSNSIINRGTWNATVIAPQYGGTGLNNVSATGLLQYSSGTASVITTSSALSTIISDGTGTAGKLVFSTTPTFTTSVVTDSGSFNVFNTTATTINAFGAATTISVGAASGTATFNSINNALSSSSGALVVTGGVGIGKSVSVGGSLNLFNGSNYAAFRYTGTANTIYTLPTTSPATGSSVLQSDASGIMSWVPMVAASSSGAGSGTVAIPDAQYRIAYYAGTGASVSSTNLITAVGTGVTILGLTNASSTTVAALSILGGLGITGNAFIGGTTVITSTSTSISTTSGALTVAGGVGIGGSLFTGTSTASSISGVVLNNGVITSGTWSATAITALYGGTGFNSYAVGDLLVASTGTSLAKLAASSNSGYVLTSTGANSVPTWQAVPPAAASSVAVIPATNSAQFSITVVSTPSGTGIGLSTVASLVINPSTGLVSLSGLAVTANTATTSTTTGALTVAGGAGIANSAFIGGMLRVGNNTFTKSYSVGDIALDNGSTTDTPALTYYWGNNLNLGTDVYSDGVGSTRYRLVYNINESGGREVFTVDTTGNLRLYSSTGANYFGLRFTGVATTTYTLPSYTPVGTAVSVLSSDPAGVMTWIGIPSGGGSGSVNSGTGGSVAFYAANGTAVSGTSLITVSGSGVTIGSNLNASSTTSAALLVMGGIAITGNAFIGGTTTITSTTSSISITSGALTVAGGVGIGGSLFTGTSVASSVSGVVLNNGAVTASTVNRVTVSTPATAATLTLANNSSLITSGANSLTLTTSGTTDVTFPTGTKTLVATDVTSLASLTTASSLNSVGTIATGTWSATAITALYGGTGFNSYAVGDLLVASTGNSLARLAANANTGYVLTSTGANSVPTWQSVPPSAASTVAVRETVLFQPFYPTFVSSSSGTGLGLSTVLTMFVNPATGVLSATGFSAGIAITIQGASPAVSTSSGALVVVGGVGIGGSLYVASASRFSSNIDSATTGTGAVVVSGGLGLAGNAFIGGTANITNSTVSTSAISGALVVSGGVGIGGSLYVGGIGASITGVTFSNSTITRGSWNATAIAPQYGGTGLNNSSATGLLQYSSGTASVITTSSALSTIISDGTGTAGKLVFSTSPTFTTSVLTDSATLAVFNTTATTVNAFGAATAVNIVSATINAIVKVNSTNDSIFADTGGALLVVGGASIGKTVSIGGRLKIFNPSLAQASTFYYSGSVNLDYTLPPVAPSGVGTSVLAASSTGIMSWVGMSAGGSASAAGSNQQIQYNNGGNFGGATGMTWNDGSNLLTLSATSTLASSATQAALRIINNNTTDPTSNIRWSPALELVGRSGVTPGFGSTYNNRFTSEVVPQGPSDYRAYLRTKYSYDLITGSPSFTNDIFRIHSTLGVGIGASNSTSNAISYFRVNTAQSGELSYVLPATYPSTGTSVLQSDTSGNLLWVNMAGGSPGGSGTVNSGTAGSVAIYLADGTAVSGTSLITTAGAGVTIGSRLNATSTIDAAVSIRGGLGVTGNAFIGGTTTITNTAVSFATNSGALVVSGGVGVGGTLSVGNMVKLGTVNYAATNVLGAFQSSVNSYNQIIIQNTNAGNQASANLVVNNDQSSDTTFYGELGMNSSAFSGSGALAAPNAVYVTATSAPLVLGTTTQHPIRFVVNGGATDMLYFSESGLAISCFANFGLRSASDLRFWNSGNTFYAGLQGGNTTANYLLSMPTSQVGAGASVIITGSDGQMYFVAPGSGIAFSSATDNTPTIRAKRPLNLQFCAGYTPLSSGPDYVVLTIPDSPENGTSQITYRLRDFYIRVESANAGVSRIQLERSAGIGSFVLAATGSSYLAGFGLTITGAGTYVTTTTTFAGAFLTSGDNLRLNWTLLNTSHANFSVQLLLEEI